MIPPFRVAELDMDPVVQAILDEELLRPDGYMHLMPASFLRSIPHGQLIAWANRQARYQLVTVELIEWLRERIAGRTAIEICAGMGDIGFHLGIPRTDARIQENEMREYYAAFGQIPTTPPDDVETLEAHAAVAKYRPQVVVGSWVTERWHEGATTGNMHGPEEVRIVREVETYITIGNRGVHGTKRICRLRHKRIQRDWLVSRAFYQDRNAIWIWGE